MFDGLLGRGGFSSKCKSLIKITRTRIDAIRRKRNATLKFLKKDIADLLSNGLETNALGRAEGLIAELCLTSCYDFIDHVCEIILKHLSTMQKDRECPEDCREAVASLIFSAARFSDLPELRDIRDIFKDRFGNSLDPYVDRKLVQHMSPNPPDMDKKLKLLDDIALEFSITWDRSAIERRNKAAAVREEKEKTRAYLNPAEDKYKAPHILEAVRKIDNDGTTAKKKIEVRDKMKGRDPIEIEQGLVYSKHNSQVGPRTMQKSKDPNALPRRREFINDWHGSLAPENGIPGRTGAASSYTTGRPDDHHSLTGGQKFVPKIEHRMAAYQVKAEPLLSKGEPHVESVVHIKPGHDVIVNSVGKLPGEEPGRLKSNLRNNIPPPYVKPKKSKHRSRHSESHVNVYVNDTLTFGAQNPEPVKDEIPHYTVEYYKGETPRRSRRRHHKPSSGRSSDNDDADEVRVVRRVSTSRRKNESKKGLQVLVDDDHHGERDDDEERMMDKLLLHYSNKPVGNGGEPSVKPPRSRTKIRSANADESPNPQTSRSMSLPHEQSSTEMKKVFTRAMSFDQETSTPAKHVHPKLPDCDDLAARFAALKSNPKLPGCDDLADRFAALKRK